MRKCEQRNCDKPHRARGMCIDHYNNWMRFGSVLSREDQLKNDAINSIADKLKQIAKREKTDNISVDRVLQLLEITRV